MALFKCKMCGGALEIAAGKTVIECEYCGTQQTLPRLDDDKRANMYDRANHFRRNNEFDKAMGIYEQILNEDSADAEAYWSLVLCRYGIEYVEDPASRKRIPTVNRAQFTSIFDDTNYKSALQYADSYQRGIYEGEAKAINEIQKGILAISQKEEPFDVFICYKETDNNGRRTPDSVLATELYHQLIQEGFRVFFSRITLEDKLGSAYEPYIFAALNSAKVMVVLSTKPEYFNAVWIKNEWSRYLALIKQGTNKMLIPAYKDMDPYDLPEEFSHLQAQDMGKLGFMQDLIRGIKKIVQTDAPQVIEVKETVVTGGNVNAAPLLERAFMFLEDGDWNSADEYCEKVLDLEPKNAQAYLGKLMVELHVKSPDALKDCAHPFDQSSNYQKAVRFADDNFKTVLIGYIEYIKNRNQNEVYESGAAAMRSAQTMEDYTAAAKIFASIANFSDASDQQKTCLARAEDCRKDNILSSAISAEQTDTVDAYESALKLLASIHGWKDADAKTQAYRERIAELKNLKEKRRKKNQTIALIVAPIICAIVAFVVVLITVIIPNGKYNDAMALLQAEKYSDAYQLFSDIHFYKDADVQARLLMRKIPLHNPISANRTQAVGLRRDGTIVAMGINGYDHPGDDIFDWKDIVAISAGNMYTVGLKADGTVVAVGYNTNGQCNVSGWKDIVAISAGNEHTVGLKSDGTVVAVGDNAYGKCDVSGWKDIVAISAGDSHTVGLNADGTVVAIGKNNHGQCNVSGWKDIVAISTDTYETFGLKSDGTVVTVGWNYLNEYDDVSNWKDIVAISAGEGHIVGLKSDGTVVATGSDRGCCNVSEWEDIAAISAGGDMTFGIKFDGTVVVQGTDDIYLALVRILFTENKFKI